MNETSLNLIKNKVGGIPSYIALFKETSMSEFTLKVCTYSIP